MPRPRVLAPEIDYYQVLAVSPKSSLAEIRKSFKRLVLEAHPDKNPGRTEWSEKRMRELIQAFEVIGNAERRADFDRQRRIVRSARRKGEMPFFFRKKDPGSRARLILHLFLNGRPRLATNLLEQMEEKLGAAFLVEYLDRPDYLDCLFLAAEHYAHQRHYVLAAERLRALYVHDRKSRFPRHYLAEVVRRLKDLYLRKLPRTARTEEAIQGLAHAEGLGLTKAEELLRLRKLTEIQARAGKLDEARQALSRARKLDPCWKGLEKAEEAIETASRKAN